MSGFHNEHLVGAYDSVCDDNTGKCQVVNAICEICKEDVSWVINRRFKWVILIVLMIWLIVNMSMIVIQVIHIASIAELIEVK